MMQELINLPSQFDPHALNFQLVNIEAEGTEIAGVVAAFKDGQRSGEETKILLVTRTRGNLLSATTVRRFKSYICLIFVRAAKFPFFVTKRLKSCLSQGHGITYISVIIR